MTPTRTRFVLLILLTLLQCFAPLLHAHAFGVGHSGGVHLFDAAERHSAGLDAAHTQVLSVYGDESPAIGMAQEYRQDSAMLLSDAAQPLLVQFPHISFRSERFLLDSPGALPAGGCYRHFIPFSQAPPQALT